MNRLTRSSTDFEEKNPKTNDCFYDVYDDWGLSEASFAQQYGIRLRSDPEMSWNEFTTLLGGLDSKTPLGKIVAIRAETNKDILKNFTPEQRKIRMEWRNKQAESVPKQNYEQVIGNFEKAFAMAFGKGGE